MMRAQGVVLKKLEVDFLETPSGKIVAQAALEGNGVNYAWLKHQIFSEQTLQKMKELIASVEEDIASFVFEEVEASGSTGSAGSTTAPSTTSSGGGLAEHLSTPRTDAEPA